MIVLPPVSIDYTNILSSTIPTPDTGEPALWNAATGYILGNQVYRAETKKIYESLSPTSTVDSTVPEIAIYATPPKWREVGYLNAYRMFDYTRNQGSVGTNTLSVSFQKADRIDTIALSGMSNVASIKVELLHNSTTYVIYDGSNSYTENSTTYYYSTRLFTSIPPLYLPEIKITLVAPGGVGTLSIAYLITGIAEDIGVIQNGLEVDATNFSTVNRDSYGNAEMVRRRSVPKIRGTTLLQPSQVDRVAQVRQKLNAAPALWVGIDDPSELYYNSLVMVGIYKAFSFELSNPVAVTATIEIEEI